MELQPKQELIAEPVSLPWLPYEAIHFLERHLTKKSLVFEWGCGCSTFWIGRRVKNLISIEHDPRWFDNVLALLRKKRLDRRVDLMFRPQAEHYVSAIEAYSDDLFDVIVVDGKWRPACLARVMPKIRNGGLLLLDNSNRIEYKQPMKLLSRHWKRIDFEGHGRINPRVPARTRKQMKVWRATFWKKP
jgi:hypothetical protein